jgi:uncharacterized protein (UPF0276 family)
MIALAVADWPLTRELLQAGALRIDYFETGGHFAEAAAARFPTQPLLLHNGVFNWSLAAEGALAQPDVLRLTLDRLALTSAPWLSVHLGFSAAEVFFEGCMQARSPALGREPLHRAICENLSALAAAVPVPLIIENLDYNPGGAYEHICEPAFITSVLEETGVGLLLDLAHARVSAAAYGMPIREYLGRLPLGRVRQIHISSPRPRGDGTLADVHEALTDDDYALLAEVLGECRPQALTLEYSRDGAALLDQIERLRALLQPVSRW